MSYKTGSNQRELTLYRFYQSQNKRPSLIKRVFNFIDNRRMDIGFHIRNIKDTINLFRR